MQKSFCLFAVAIILVENAHSQSASLDDLFPLAVGTMWEYSYSTYYSDLEQVQISDIGIAAYQVMGKLEAGDSISWAIRTSLDFTRFLHYLFGYGHDTSYPVQASSGFELIENLRGQHRLYRPQSTYNIWGSVLPFGSDFADSTPVSRYCRPDSGDTKVLHCLTRMGEFVCTITLKRDSGCTAVDLSNWHLTGASYRTSHRLRRVVTTDVREDKNRENPDIFTLHQNYPNPFNPQTKIGFQVASSEFVSLKVYDVLGREVATLANEELAPGSYKRTFDASAIASGVYFYRLVGARFTATRKLTIIR